MVAKNGNTGNGHLTELLAVVAHGRPVAGDEPQDEPQDEPCGDAAWQDKVQKGAIQRAAEAQTARGQAIADLEAKLALEKHLQAEEEAQRAALEGADPEARRNVYRERIRLAIGADVVRIARYDSDPPLYVLELANGRSAQMGGMDRLTTCGEARKIFCNIGHIVPDMKRDAWLELFAALMEMVEDVHLGKPQGELERFAEMVSDYILGTYQVRLDTLEMPPGYQAGVYSAGSLHIRLSGFLDWMKVHRASSAIQEGKALRGLKGLGAERVSLKVGQRTDGVDTRKTLSYYRLSERFDHLIKDSVRTEPKPKPVARPPHTGGDFVGEHHDIVFPQKVQAAQ